MTGRDVDSSPTQYRTWVVDGYPDLDGNLYTGLKGGSNPLADIYAYTVPDDSIVDFNLPNPTSWSKTYRVLPEKIYDSQLAIIDGYVYLFGGNTTDKIFRAPLNRPADWKDTGARLPTPLYGSQLVISNVTIYLIGGNNGIATDTVYSADISNPLEWTNEGSCLPKPVYHAQLLAVEGNLYLLGGQGINNPTNSIFVAQADDPLTWTQSSHTLPENLYGSQGAIIGDYLYLFGGVINNAPTVNIYRATISEPELWSSVGNLPYAISFGQFITIGDNGYLFTIDKERTTIYIFGHYIDIGSQAYSTQIFKCQLSNPLSWTCQSESIPAELFQSQAAIINDRLFLFGGNGNTAIFADNSIVHYPLTSPDAVAYGNKTRTEFYAETDKLALNSLLGFPYWKVDYLNEAPTYFLFAEFTSNYNQHSYIRVDNGKQFKIDWGDGYVWLYTGSGELEELTREYAGRTYTQKWYAINHREDIKEFTCSGNFLSGHIRFPKLFTELTEFNCSNNSLTGTISSIATNTNLVSFNGDTNQFSGDIPSLVNNVNLRNFEVNNNQLTGHIPSLHTNTNIIVFDCGYNQLTGPIPSLNMNVNLVTFNCQNNQLTGHLPLLATNLMLENLSCNDNQLTGGIPSLVHNADLIIFRIENNQITGSIPSLDNNTALEIFWAANNQLSGTIPSLTNNTSLLSFRVSDNQLTGVIPSLTGLVNLEFFSCGDNRLTEYTPSTIPVSLTNFEAYNNLLSEEATDQILADFAYNISSRPTSGTIVLTGTGNSPPSRDGLLYKYDIEARGWTVLVNSTAYTFSFTTSETALELRFTVATGIRYLIDYGDSSGTTAHGTCGEQVFDHIYSTSGPYTLVITIDHYAALIGFWCYSDQLLGNIPSLSTNIALYDFQCAYNQLTGSIPALTGPAALDYFDCSWNQITGSIPELNSFQRVFDCSGNLLTGSIPDLSTNTRLAYFGCAYNQLTGSIPSFNTNLHNFECDNNLLTGSIPSLSSNTLLQQFSCASNQLTGFVGGTMPSSLLYFYADNNLLTQSAVDSILAAFVAAGASGGWLVLNGTGNATPSAAGLTDKATLVSRSWTVFTN